MPAQRSAADLGADPLVRPTHAVDRHDPIARLEHGRRRAAVLDPGHVHRRSAGLSVRHQQHPDDQKRDQDVDRRTGADHEDPLPHRLVVVGARPDAVGHLLVRVHAGDLHVATQRDRPDPVLRLAAPELDQHRSEEQREPLHAHADGLRSREVAGLVQDDQRGKAEERQYVGHRSPSVPSPGNKTFRLSPAPRRARPRPCGHLRQRRPACRTSARAVRAGARASPRSRPRFPKTAAARQERRAPRPRWRH